MLLRTTLVLVIIASFITCGLTLHKVKERITGLRTDLARQTAARTTAESELATTKEARARTIEALARTEERLEAAKATNARTSAELADRNKKIADLSDRLNEQDWKLQESETLLTAFNATGLTLAQAVHAGDRITDLENALTAAHITNERLQALLPKQRDGEAVRLPPDLKANVMVSDPKWHFVVLNAGQDQGVVEHGSLLASRGGTLVAKLKVSRVEKNRCVANVEPGWELAEIMEGDMAVPAN
jgi:hypothetical protein